MSKFSDHPYVSSAIVTYNYYDDRFHEYNLMHNVDLSIIDEEDKTGDISDTLFKAELVGVFSLLDFNLKELSFKIREILSILEKDDVMLELICLSKSLLDSDDNFVGIALLFSYEFFYVFHRCVGEYLTVGSVSPILISFLKKLLSNLKI